MSQGNARTSFATGMDIAWSGVNATVRLPSLVMPANSTVSSHILSTVVVVAAAVSSSHYI